MLNQVQLIGNLGRDPEIRRTHSGDAIANLRIATSESWKDKSTGERKERTEWHSVVIFGPLAGVAEQYLKKGSKVFVQGQLRTRTYQNQAGVDVYTTEVVLQGFSAVLTMLGDPPGSQRDGGERSDQGSRRGITDSPEDRRPSGFGSRTTDQTQQGKFSADEMDDEIPF